MNKYVQLVIWQVVAIFTTIVVFHFVKALGMSEPVCAVAAALTVAIVGTSFVGFVIVAALAFWAAAVAALAVSGSIGAETVAVTVVLSVVAAFFAVSVAGLVAVAAADAGVVVIKYDIRFSWILVVLFTESTSIFAAMFFGGMTGIGMAAVGIVILVLLALFGKSRALRYHSPA